MQDKNCPYISVIQLSHKKCTEHVFPPLNTVNRFGNCRLSLYPTSDNRFMSSTSSINNNKIKILLIVLWKLADICLQRDVCAMCMQVSDSSTENRMDVCRLNIMNLLHCGLATCCGRLIKRNQIIDLIECISYFKYRLFSSSAATT